MSEQSAKLFQAVFENSPVGLVLVNKDTSLRDVNQYMFNIFDLTPGSVQGQKFGNVFNCAAVSGSDQTCGESEACSQCGLRGGVTAVLDEGITIPDTIMDHKFTINATDRKKWFKISASRIASEGDTVAIVSFVDITTQKEYEELLNSQLSLDMSTGITNKYTLLNTLKSLTMSGEDMAIALIDFDSFKAINDSYGHVIGDKVINHFCFAASANTRKQDVVGRFGGEEFMLIFTGASSGMLIKVLQRISKSFMAACSKELNIKPTFSVGIAEFSCGQMAQMDVDAIIEEADSNLYLSKSRGKNRITVGGISMTFE